MRSRRDKICLRNSGVQLAVYQSSKTRTAAVAALRLARGNARRPLHGGYTT
jgi:hypothetical protein